METNKILDYAIKESKLILNNEQNIKIDPASLCLICCKILQEHGIKSEVVHINRNMFYYYFVVATSVIDGEQKYYILDPFFNAFSKQKQQYYEYTKSNLENTYKGKKLHRQLIYLGYFECDVEALKLYCDAIWLSMNEKIKNKPSSITGESYFKNLILNCFPETKVKTKTR